MAMTSVLSRFPIGVTRPMESALGANAIRCFSECKGLVSVSVTRPMESIRGATLCLSVRKDLAQNHECAADNNNMQIWGIWNHRSDCWKSYAVLENDETEESEETDEPEIKANQEEEEEEEEDDAHEAGDKSPTFGEKVVIHSKKAMSKVRRILGWDHA